jgi:hypothetical protein
MAQANKASYGPRRGLQGPYVFVNGRILYFDPKEDSYYDPRTDFYVPSEEVEELNDLMLERLKNLA